MDHMWESRIGVKGKKGSRMVAGKIEKTVGGTDLGRKIRNSALDVNSKCN